MGNLTKPWVVLTLAGLLITSALMIRKVKGAILWGMLATTVIAIAAGQIRPDLSHGLAGALVSAPPSLDPTFLKLDLKGALTLGMIPIITVFLFMLLFDTVGTLIGVAQPAGMLKDGKLPRAERALVSDAVATTVGALLGTSTTSSYIESATGISEGARTGLANMVTGLLFLLALFFSPLVRLVGGGIADGAAVYNPVTAPVLIIVGCLMLSHMAKLNPEDPSESIPAFLTIIGTPLTFNIAYGLALGFISYPLLKLLGGRGKEVSTTVYVIAVILALGLYFKETYFLGK
jgi:AGZA family xanthine/uracil permease-like MFS transporter